MKTKQKHGGNPFELNINIGVAKDSGIERSTLLATIASGGESYGFYYRQVNGKATEDLRLVPIDINTEIELATVNPLSTQKEDVETIILIEISQHKMVAHEVGVARIGRGDQRKLFLIQKAKWKVCYGLTEVNTLDTDGGLKFRPLINELERVLIDLADDLDPAMEAKKNGFLVSRALPSEKVTVKNWFAVQVLEVNFLNGFANGVNGKGKTVMILLSAFTDKEKALRDLKPGSMVRVSEFKPLRREGRFDFGVVGQAEYPIQTKGNQNRDENSDGHLKVA